jgi:hypothetical protein
MEKRRSCALRLDQAHPSDVRLSVELFEQERKRAPDPCPPGTPGLESGQRSPSETLDLCVERRNQTRFAIVEELVERATRDTRLLAYPPDASRLQATLPHHFDDRQQQTATLHLDDVRALTARAIPFRALEISREPLLKRRLLEP